MEYTTLTQEEMNDIIVAYYKAQEKDLYVHELNKQRYSELLNTLEEGDLKTKVQGLLTDTESRIKEVTSIIQSTQPQLPTEQEINDSLVRLATKEETAV